MKLRLLLFDECNRNCTGCCNKDWPLENLPICTDYSPYELIMLTGGEPMLHPEIIREAVASIREQTTAPVFLYTALAKSPSGVSLDELLPELDGVTFTLHTKEDVLSFQQFDLAAKNLYGKSLRLNVFEEVGAFYCHEQWQAKEHMT